MELDAAIRERDLALAMHETFMTSGSEDGLSPRFQNLESRVSPRSPSSRFLGGLSGSFNYRAGVVTARELNEAYLKNLRNTEFGNHERGAARLNHGSFGSCPKSVLAVQAEWMQLWMKQPDAFYFSGLEAGLSKARQAVADHVNCPVEELVLVDNATVSASIVAMDVMWGFADGRHNKGDSILMLNLAYKAVSKAFQAYAVRAGAQLLVVDIPFPVSSPSEILSALDEVLKKARDDGRVIRLAVIDHIVSMPSIILPVKDMVAMCRRYGVQEVFVDGAQAIGQVEINVQEIDADYYTSNLNKWLFAPTTAALFHCKAQHLSRLHHPIVSHNHGKGLVQECNWIGTRDYSALLTVPACFQFVNSVPGGLKAIIAHNHEKVLAVGQMLGEAWGTSCGVSSPDMVGSMVTVGLPPALKIFSAGDAHALRTSLRQDFSIEVHTYVPPRKEDEEDLRVTKGVTAYLRISYQLYNTWDEYLRLRDAINFLVDQPRSNDSK